MNAVPDHSWDPGVIKADVLQPSMWQSMARTVREVDEDRVRDSKEDIDTLLVFAGLFSAVLSAFLIESYKLLQPDTDSQMVYLLQTIAFQNYSVSPPFVNITSPPAPFGGPTPDWAVTVNGLWFASLIVSLATASLGMLVQSWLREYLAGEWISPQEKLRARQYRHPAMDRWLVFEIAAALPLLIQVALGLFFVGLCFFTQAVDHRMGDTAIPLVIAWAFFFAMTTLAPLISPRCPFKLPLLKRIMRQGRKYFMPPLFALARACYASYRALYHPERASFLPRHHHSLPLHLRFTLLAATRVTSALQTIGYIYPSSLQPSRTTMVGCLGRLLSSRFVKVMSRSTLRLSYLAQKVLAMGHVGEEEETVVTRAQDDLETLLAIDRIMVNDGLLVMMREAVRQSKAKAGAILSFVSGVVHHRATLPPSDLDGVIDLTYLSRDAYNVVIELTTHALTIWVDERENIWPQPSANGGYINAIFRALADSTDHSPILQSDDLVNRICSAMVLTKSSSTTAALFVLRVVNSRLATHRAAFNKEKLVHFDHVLSHDILARLISTVFRILKPEKNWIQHYSASSWGRPLANIIVSGPADGPFQSIPRSRSPVVFIDDDTALTMACHALQLYRLDPELIVTFVENNIRSRGGEQASSSAEGDLTTLSISAYVGLRDLLLKTVANAPVPTSDTSPDASWMMRASALLVSPPPPYAPRIFDINSVAAVVRAATCLQLRPALAIDIALWATPYLPGRAEKSLQMSISTRPTPTERVSKQLLPVIASRIMLAVNELDSIPRSNQKDYLTYSKRALDAFFSPPKRLFPRLEVLELLQALDLETLTWIVDSEPELAIHFTRRLLRQFATSDTGTIVHLRGISKPVYHKLMDATSRALAARLPVIHRKHEIQLEVDAVFSLFSVSGMELPQSASHLLGSIMFNTESFIWLNDTFTNQISRSIENLQAFTPLAPILTQLYYDSYSLDHGAVISLQETGSVVSPQVCIQPVLQLYGCLLRSMTSKFRIRSSRSAPLWLSIPQWLPSRPAHHTKPEWRILHDVMDFVEGFLSATATLLDESKLFKRGFEETRENSRVPFLNPDEVAECIYILFSLQRLLTAHNRVTKLVRRYWKSQHTSHEILRALSILHPHASIPLQDVSECVTEAFLNSDETSRNIMLQNSIVTLDLMYSDATTLDDAIDMVKLCHLHVRLFDDYNTMSRWLVKPSAGQGNTDEHTSCGPKAAENPIHDTSAVNWLDGRDKTAVTGYDSPEVSHGPTSAEQVEVWSQLWRSMAIALRKYRDERGWLQKPSASRWHYTGTLKLLSASKPDAILRYDRDLARETLYRAQTLSLPEVLLSVLRSFEALQPEAPELSPSLSSPYLSVPQVSTHSGFDEDEGHTPPSPLLKDFAKASDVVRITGVLEAPAEHDESNGQYRPAEGSIRNDDLAFGHDNFPPTAVSYFSGNGANTEPDDRDWSPVIPRYVPWQSEDDERASQAVGLEYPYYDLWPSEDGEPAPQAAGSEYPYHDLWPNEDGEVASLVPVGPEYSHYDSWQSEEDELASQAMGSEYVDVQFGSPIPEVIVVSGSDPGDGGYHSEDVGDIQDTLNDNYGRPAHVESRNM